MKRLLQKGLTVVVLAAGLAMVAWGGRGFTDHVRAKAAASATTDDEGGPRIRICPPTAGELTEQFGLGVAAGKLGCLAIAGVGLFIAGGSLLSLMERKERV